MLDDEKIYPFFCHFRIFRPTWTSTVFSKLISLAIVLK
jgi:hypothetical protein